MYYVLVSVSGPLREATNIILFNPLNSAVELGNYFILIFQVRDQSVSEGL